MMATADETVGMIKGLAEVVKAQQLAHSPSPDGNDAPGLSLPYVKNNYTI